MKRFNTFILSILSTVILLNLPQIGLCFHGGGHSRFSHGVGLHAEVHGIHEEHRAAPFSSHKISTSTAKHFHEQNVHGNVHPMMLNQPHTGPEGHGNIPHHDLKPLPHQPFKSPLSHISNKELPKPFEYTWTKNLNDNWQHRVNNVWWGDHWSNHWPNNWWGNRWYYSNWFYNNWYYRNVFYRPVLHPYFFLPYWSFYQPFYTSFYYVPFTYVITSNYLSNYSEPTIATSIPKTEIWVQASNGSVPANAIVKSTENNQTTFHCRAKLMNQIKYGELVPNDGCYVEDKSVTMRFNDYEVLVSH